MIDFDVIGLPVLLAALDAKATEIETLGKREATLAAADKVRAEWVSNISSEGLVDTGRYRDSVGVVEDGGAVFVTTDVPYARFLEHGTAYIAPHPVAERALEEHADEAIDAAAGPIRGRL